MASSNLNGGKACGSFPWITVAAGLLAGLAAWFAIEQVHPLLRIEAPVVQSARRAINQPATQAEWLQMGSAMTAASQRITIADRHAKRQADWKSSAFGIGLFGVVVGGACGLAEGVRRRSRGLAAAGLATGAMLCAPLGALAGLAGKFTQEHRFLYYDDILKTMLVQAVMWSILGIAVGLGMSLPTRRPAVMVRYVLGSVIGGLTSALVFSAIAAWFFPLDNTLPIVPDGTSTRLLWAVLTAGLMATIAAWHGAAKEPGASPVPAMTVPAAG